MTLPLVVATSQIVLWHRRLRGSTRIFPADQKIFSLGDKIASRALLSRPSGVASESPGNGASVKPEPLDVCSGLRMLQQPSIDEHATPILYGVKSIKVLKPKMHVSDRKVVHVLWRIIMR